MVLIKKKKDSNTYRESKNHPYCERFWIVLCMIYWTSFILSLTLVPPEMCLLGCVFYITDYVKIVGQSEIDKWKKVSLDTLFDIRFTIRI